MKKYLFSSIIVFCAVVSYAQWEPDVRLTNNSASSKRPSVIVSGSAVHVAWQDDRDGNYDIYYKRSNNSGINWTTDTRLTTDPANSYRPFITVSGSIVHVAWEDDRDGNFEIYYKRSPDGGINWTAGTRLTTNPAFSGYTSIAVSGSVVHVVWVDYRDGNYEIYYKRSTDGGLIWGSDTRLTSNTALSDCPSVTGSGSVVHVVWHDNRDGNLEIYYKRSNNSGINWVADTRLTTNPANSKYPYIAVFGSDIHIVWQDDRDGNEEIYYKRSPDGGINWTAGTRLTTNTAHSEYPSVIASGSTVHIVWQDNRDGNEEIYYKRSTDAGIIWGTDTRLTTSSAFSGLASVAVSGSVVHVVWQDYRNGNDEIYYKRNPTGNPFGITKIGTEIPNEFNLYQNYPNPFNPSSTIKFDIPKETNVKIVIYDVLGREVAVVVNQTLIPGTYEVEFDGSNLPSGVYLYKLEASDYVEVRKMVLIK